MAKATERQKELRRIRYRENIDVERERSRAYYHANKERILERRRLIEQGLLKPGENTRKSGPNRVLTDEQRKDYQKNYQKNYYLKKVKSKKKKGRYLTKESLFYISELELTRELKLAKGRGKASERLLYLFYILCERINRKFHYVNQADKYDVIMDSYFHIMTGYMDVNIERYNHTLPYITEIIKRAQAKSFNKIRGKGLVGKGFEGSSFIDLLYSRKNDGVFEYLL
jgi:hypothetical protein